MTKMPSPDLPKGVRIPPDSGETYQPADDLLEWMGDRFAKFGDTYRASVHGTSVYLTRDAGFAHHVLVRNWRNYVKGRLIKRVALLLGNGLMVSEGELWKRQRRMIQPELHGEQLANVAQAVMAVNSVLLAKWQAAAERNESVNVTRDVSGMALEVVLRAIFGSDYDQIGSHFSLVSERPERDLAFANAFRGLRPIILGLAVQRRKVPRASDILGALLGARDSRTGQAMDDRQLINEVITLIVAGHETTASTLNWLWYLLSQHPAAEEKLADEVARFPGFPELADLSKFTYARQVIEETLRLYPAGWLLTRRALGDDRLGDFFVPAGTESYVPPYFIQRNPSLWKDPESFQPERFESDEVKCHSRVATIPFSAGPRNCVGESMSRIEMQMHLVMIAKHARLQYVQSRGLQLDAGVNLRCKYDFVMYPQLKAAQKTPAGSEVSKAIARAAGKSA